MIKPILEVRVSAEGKIFNKDGTLICDSPGDYMLVSKEDLNALMDATELCEIERTLLMETAFMNEFPDAFEVEGVKYYRSPTLHMVTGKVIYVRYRSMDVELEEDGPFEICGG